MATDDISEVDQIQTILKKNHLSDVKIGAMRMKIHRNFNLKLIQNGMVNYQEPIFSLKGINEKV